MNLTNILTNYKTSSAGAALIVAGLSNLIWGWYSKSLTAQDVKESVGAIVIGLGFAAAGDAAASVTKAQAVATFVRFPDAPAQPAAPAVPASPAVDPNKLPK